MRHFYKILNIFKNRKEILFIIFAFLLSNNASGQILIPFKSQMTGKFGYIDESGNIVISAQYYKANPFYDGIALVDEGLKQYYINSSGKIIYKPTEPADLFDFSCGFGRVETRTATFFIDVNGKIRSPKYNHSNSFSENLAVVRKENKIYAVNKLFQMLFEIEVDVMNPGDYFGFFNDGMMPIKNIKDEWGYIDKNGKIVIKPSYRFPGIFSNGYAIVKDLKGILYVINKTGEKIYELVFDDYYDLPEYQAFIHNNYIVYHPKRGIIKIVKLGENITKEFKSSNLSNRNNDYSRPILLGDYIFYDGNVFDFEGNIIWKVDNYRYREDIVYYNNYILIDASSDKMQLYKYDGTRINLP